MKRDDLDLIDPTLDTFLARWLEGSLGDAERREWERTLVFNGPLREALCDWIKSLREPGLARRRKENEK
jgi:hypothetical protein